MFDQRPFIITRKARIWPEITGAKLVFPHIPDTQITAHSAILATMLSTIIVISCSFCVLSQSGTHTTQLLQPASLFIFGCLITSALLFSFFWLKITGWKRIRQQHIYYKNNVMELQHKIQDLNIQERQARIKIDPPLLISTQFPLVVYDNIEVEAIIKRNYNNHDVDLWSRKPEDPDFLMVRIGMGQLKPTFSLPELTESYLQALPSDLQTQVNTLQEIAGQARAVIAPIKLRLTGGNTTALVGNTHLLNRARQLALNSLAYLAYHHSPEDVRVIIMAPASQRAQWEWTNQLPHTLTYDSRRSLNENYDEHNGHDVAIGNEAILHLLPHISRELSYRALLLKDMQETETHTHPHPILPRLVIIVDAFDETEDLDHELQQPLTGLRQRHATELNRPHLYTSPLNRSEMALALNAPEMLGVTVLAICGHRKDIPASAKQIVDLVSNSQHKQKKNENPMQLSSSSGTDYPHSVKSHMPGGFAPDDDINPVQEMYQARILHTQIQPASTLYCDWLDDVPLEALTYLASRLQPLRPGTTRNLDLRTQVDICPLFDPPIDAANYNPHHYWKDPASGSANPISQIRIPIGLKIGDEIQYLDLSQDGPHGVLIGQTGSGKSELLQTIITALSITYRPDEIHFLLVDGKTGYTLETFKHLPHTIGTLSSVSTPGQIERFIVLLRAEIQKRQILRKGGVSIPHLVLIIDEFPLLLAYRENLLQELFALTQPEQETGIHLLLAAQHLDADISAQVLDHVHYRLCMRCANPDESRMILRRTDAANIPASIPGRTYLLHGDNQYDLFQAARVTIPITLPAQNIFRLSKLRAFA